MKFARLAVAAVLLFFAWKGSTLDIPWPPTPFTEIKTPKPDPQILKWAEPVQKILPRMLPTDRRYLANLYDAMAYVLLKDRDRAQPIIDTTDKWVAFHTATLQLAIERANVGKYPGLGEAIDETIINAIGADPKGIDKDTGTKLIAACGVLSWTFTVHHE